MSNFSGKLLHVIALDVPAPPDYGGVIDIYYKLKALARLGIKIHLHCFQFGRAQSSDLESFCDRVYYYPRKTLLRGLSLIYPYNVYSRRDKKLLKYLRSLDAPILMEGAHCAYYLNDKGLKKRKILLRTHNVETDYFSQLAQKSDGFLLKLYRYHEAMQFRNFERRLDRVDAFLAISRNDRAYFQKLYPRHECAYIPAFSDMDISAAKIIPGRGNYVLYHGNLGHPENVEAALYIMKEICTQLPEITFVFVGKNPTLGLQTIAHEMNNVQIVANPTMEEMDDLIIAAHIHLLLTFQATGLKLKLLKAFSSGRFIIANKEMMNGFSPTTTCLLVNKGKEITKAIMKLMKQKFTDEDIEQRKAFLETEFSNLKYAQEIADLAFS